MILIISEAHDLREFSEIVKSSGPINFYDLLTKIYPQAAAASKRMRDNWQDIDVIPALSGELVMRVSFLYGQRASPSMVKRTTKTKTGYRSGVTLFKDDLSVGISERPADEIYATLEQRVLAAIDDIRERNSLP